MSLTGYDRWKTREPDTYDDAPRFETCFLCEGSGEVAHFVSYPCGYAGAGLVPDYARGVRGFVCEACNGAGVVDEGEP